jgi:molecular chaperone HtpG
MSDRVDEWVLSGLTEFDGKPLQSVTQGNFDLGTLGQDVEPSKEVQEQREGEYKDVIERITEVLGERASAVRLTHRLTDSPACLVSDSEGMSLNLERLLKASGQPVTASRPVLEINPEHPIVERLRQESDPNLFSDWSHILFDQATLAEGGHLDDPAGFVKRLNKLTLTLAGAPASRIWTP